uniref:DUF4939 domain-containing protein n=1 Tax=Takifugu rubripes TaxID=31033 RepID=A0A674P9V0_TAKRU
LDGFFPLCPPTNPATQPREPYIPIPGRYSGDLGTCSQFLHQCQLVFTQQPLTYSTPQAKTAFVMSLLTGQAAAWSVAPRDRAELYLFLLPTKVLVDSGADESFIDSDF